MRLKFRVCAILFFPSVGGAINAKYLCLTYFRLVCDTACFLFALFCFVSITGLLSSFIFSPSSSNAVWCILCRLWMPAGSVLSS